MDCHFKLLVFAATNDRASIFAAKVKVPDLTTMTTMTAKCLKIWILIHRVMDIIKTSNSSGPEYTEFEVDPAEDFFGS